MKKSLRNILLISTIITGVTTGIWAMGNNETAETVASASQTAPGQPGFPSAGESAAVEAQEIELSSLNTEDVFDYSKNDLTEYTVEDAQYEITLTNESVTITEGGIYHVTGTLTEGQIIVEASKEEDVILILDGVDITCTDSAPILINQADKVIISLTEGSENFLSDKSSGTLSEEESSAEAVIYSKDDLTINGSGTLTIYANRNNGIQGKDDVTIMSGEIAISSADDGIVGKDSVVIHDASLLILSDGDGIKSTNEESSDTGYIAIEGGDISIRSQGDALQAATSLLITDGNFTLVTGSGTYSESDSQKGLKAEKNITVSGGTFTLYTSDDAVHSNDELVVDGGTFTIATADDAFHSDNTLVINDGLIDIQQAYEGIESASISLNGGTITMVTSDDGLNASTGSEGGSFGPMAPGAQGSGTALLQITGGTINLTAGGDGLDSNGSILMSGGDVTVNGPTDNGNGSLDYDAAFTLTGGSLVTAGSSGMVQTPSTSSSQLSILMTYSGTQKAGTVVTLLDAAGNTVAEVTGATQFQSVLISTPEITDGEAYTIMTGSEETVSFSAATGTTWVNESGVTTASTGMGGRGGMQQPRGGFRN